LTNQKKHQTNMFDETQEDLPLFSGVAPRAKHPAPFNPPPEAQLFLFPKLQRLDYDELCANRTKIIRAKRRKRNGNRNR
jgi:hypothetical protein